MQEQVLIPKISFLYNQAYCAWILDHAIRNKKFNEVKRLLGYEKTFQSCSQAIILQEVCQGKIKHNTPFSGQKEWDLWGDDCIDKAAFRYTALHLIEEQSKVAETLALAHRLYYAYTQISSLKDK
jgi:hypothetical protein